MKLQILSENVLREKYAKGEEKQLPGHQAIDAIRQHIAFSLYKSINKTNQIAP